MDDTSPISNPPAPPAKSGGGFYRLLATFSWLSIPLSILFNVGRAGTPPPANQVEALAHTVASAMIPASGIICGLVALLGIFRHGRKGILGPAVTGLVLWVALAALAIPTFNRIQKHAKDLRAKATTQTPAVRSTGAMRVEDPELGFSLDLPAGYIAFPESAKPVGIKHAFIHELLSENSRVLLVKPLGGTISRQKMRPEHLPPDTPVRTASLTPFSWRGMEVEGVRLLETQGTVKYVTFQIQIPLRGQAIQLGVGGAEQSEVKVRDIANQVLASLEGQHSW